MAKVSAREMLKAEGLAIEKEVVRKVRLCSGLSLLMGEKATTSGESFELVAPQMITLY